MKDIYDPRQQTTFVDFVTEILATPLSLQEKKDREKKKISELLFDYPHLIPFSDHIEKVVQLLIAEELKSRDAKISKLESDIQSLAEDIGYLLAFRDKTAAQLTTIENRKGSVNGHRKG